MSIFVVPVQDNFHQSRPTNSSFAARCGPCVGTQSAWDVDPFHRRNVIPHALLGALLGDVEEDGDDRDVFMSSSPSLSPWEQHIAQLRRREQLAAAEAHQRRRAAALQARQQQIERERVRRERERAARLAWQQEQQARAEAAALDYQRRVQAYRKRQEEEYAQRVKLAQRRQAEWEQAASHAFLGVMDIVGQLFGGEEQQEEEAAQVSSSKAEGKKPEKTATTATQEEKAAEPEKTEEMQVDEPQVAPTEVEVEKTPAAEEQVQVAATAAEAPKEVTQQPSDRLVFTYPLPHDEATRSSIKAEDINVTYDETTHTINLTGLWSDETNNDSASSSSTVQSEGESRGRKRSRSPKRSRVSDVDETTGEEITKPEEDSAHDDDYVQVQTTTKPVPVSVSKSIRLPEGATVDNLRAELTDEGFKIFL